MQSNRPLYVGAVIWATVLTLAVYSFFLWARESWRPWEAGACPSGFVEFGLELLYSVFGLGVFILAAVGPLLPEVDDRWVAPYVIVPTCLCLTNVLVGLFIARIIVSIR